MKIKLIHILTAVMILLIPNLNFGQTIDLGTAANFVLFSTTGAVSNSGLSILTGNVGTNNGSITGFGNVNGVMNNANGVSSQCASDLLIAYNQLNSTIPTFFPSPLLGNGDTLIAGVYSIGAASTLNLNLYLNANGNPNAKFIFQIQGAFSTSVNSNVKLINGAEACNVFWKVEGLVDMASGTTMRGTVIANNAAINMYTGGTLEGRALSTTGAVTVAGISAYTPIGCGSPVLNGPSAPALGTTGCYALFSSNGSVSNSGITNVTGDIGSNVGSVAGFNALNVIGDIHPIPDVSTAVCANDLSTVYTYLSTLSPNIELLYPAQFGNNLELTPHTYLLNAATVLTDSLYLNAQGNANGVFVIKINGALSTSTYSSVKLINGAQSKNIYWIVEGAVNINNYSVFRGTIISNNGAIAINTGVVLDGGVLATNGALSVADVTAAKIPSNCVGAFPIELLTFRGEAMRDKILLNWATATELENAYFEIQKSNDKNNFEPIGRLNGAGNSQQINRYKFTDNNPYLGNNTYRLRQVDINGDFSYSNTVLLSYTINEAGIIGVAPNPTSESLDISFFQPRKKPVNIVIYDINGQILQEDNIECNSVVNTYRVNVESFPQGIYVVKLTINGREYICESRVENKLFYAFLPRSGYIFVENVFPHVPFSR